MTTPKKPKALDFAGLVAAIRQTDAALSEQVQKAVNLGLTLRNWCIGCYLAEFEQNGADRAEYGAQLLDKVSARLEQAGMAGVAARSLRQYRQFYLAYPQIWQTPSAKSLQAVLPSAIWQTLSARLSIADIREAVSPESNKVGTASPPSAAGPLSGSLLLERLSFSHFVELLQLDDPFQRRFYEVEALRGNWSVRELKRQIASQYFQRSGLSTDKEALARLAHAQAESAASRQIIRDPYVFEFLGLKPQEVMGESHLEDALLDKLQEFLLELGHGFCFEARQKRLLIGGDHFFVDLVFYHRVLKCHVLIELKNDAFKHEHLGQLNSYVGYYAKNEMAEGDQPPVGILLCTRKNQELVEYALAGMSNTLFVSRYQVQLPDKEEIAAFLHKAVEELGGAGMSEWRTLPLEDCMAAIIDYRGKSPNKTTSGVPLVTAKIVKGGKISTPEEFIAEADYEEWMSRGIPQAGDVVMTTEAPLGEVAQLDGSKVALAQRIITLRGKPGILDQNFLKFLLQSQPVQEELRSRATGTTVVGIRQSELRKVNLPLPPYETQRTIGNILGTLDDKIDLNRRMNETLEAMARAIFKSWFVDFDPVRAKACGEPPESICRRLGLTPDSLALFPDGFQDSELGEIPKEWHPIRMDEILELAYGKALKANERIDGPVPVYGSGGITGYHDRRLIDGPAIVVGRKGTVGSLYWEDRPLYPIDTVFYVKPKAPLSYCYYLLQTLGLEAMNTDAAVPGLNRNNVYRLQVPLTPDPIQQAFDNVAMSFRNRIHANGRESEIIRNVRDTLLPKLLSAGLPTTTDRSH